MSNSCRIFPTEYSRHYINWKHKRAETIGEPRDYFAERIREGEIDPRVASIPTQLDEAAEQLVYKHVLDNARSVYQVTYRNPWAPREEEQSKDAKETDFQSELITYIRDLYLTPHDEKILAPPVTTKRLFGYIRPKLLHGSLSMYQDTINRTGATVMLQEHDRKLATTSGKMEHGNPEIHANEKDPCAFEDTKE